MPGKINIAVIYIELMRKIVKEVLKSEVEGLAKVAPADLYAHLEEVCAKKKRAGGRVNAFELLMNRGRGHYTKHFGQFSLLCH